VTPEAFNLTGRTALVTGATGYLGSAMARWLAGAGAHVFLNSRSEELCHRLEREIKEHGGSAESAPFDVTNDESIAEFISKRNLCRLHVLVNNAYSGKSGSIHSSTANLYAESYDVAVCSAHRVLTAFLDLLKDGVKEAGDASVINIASMYGLVSPDLRIYASNENANPPFYGAAKAALIQWSRYAACELGPQGIRVNSVSPGPFPPPSVQDGNPKFIDSLARRVPLGRIGDAPEVAGPVLFLASRASSYVNGSNIVVDGGWTAW